MPDDGCIGHVQFTTWRMRQAAPAALLDVALAGPHAAARYATLARQRGLAAPDPERLAAPAGGDLRLATAALDVLAGNDKQARDRAWRAAWDRAEEAVNDHVIWAEISATAEELLRAPHGVLRFDDLRRLGLCQPGKWQSRRAPPAAARAPSACSVPRAELVAIAAQYHLDADNPLVELEWRKRQLTPKQRAAMQAYARSFPAARPWSMM